jgi:aminoglycoside phosphotransferase (APT) family kinase protein
MSEWGGRILSMTDSPADETHDPALIAQLTRLAAEIFTRHGVDFACTRRGGGWTNATWLGGGLVLRIATEAGSQNLLREAALAGWLPAQVGYPALVERGAFEEHAYTLAKEVPGTCLGVAWPRLGWAERVTALRGLWQCVEGVHTLGEAQVGAIARRRAWFNSGDAAEARASLEQVVAQQVLAPRQAAALGQLLERFFQALPAAQVVLNHGDMTLDNAMWQAGGVVALLDFEYAVLAPAQLDLNHLVKLAFGPQDEQSAPGTDAPGTGDPSPGGQGRERLQVAVTGLARPLLAQPGGRDLLAGYAVLLELWLLQTWLAHPEGEGPLETWLPLRRLLALAEAHGGYLGDVG